MRVALTKALKNSRASLKPSVIHCLSLVALSYLYSEKENDLETLLLCIKNEEDVTA